jgi:hypothetical protein
MRVVMAVALCVASDIALAQISLQPPQQGPPARASSRAGAAPPPRPATTAAPVPRASAPAPAWRTVAPTAFPQRAASVQPAAAVIPLPRPRPPEAGPGALAAPALPPQQSPLQQPAQPSAEPSVPVASEPPPPTDCFVNLSQNLAVVSQLPPIAEPNGCEAQDVVRLEAVLLPDNRRVPLKPAATLRCKIATEIANWVRNDLALAVTPLGAPIAGIENYDSFSCRGRNNIPGAQISEHGRANALDIRGFLLANGKRVSLTDPEVAKGFRDSVRASACARFATVLGPGSDGYHEDHIHVDLAERRNNFKLCQWDVRLPEPVIPLPQERPPEAPPREEQ